MNGLLLLFWGGSGYTNCDCDEQVDVEWNMKRDGDAGSWREGQEEERDESRGWSREIKGEEGEEGEIKTLKQTMSSILTHSDVRRPERGGMPQRSDSRLPSSSLSLPPSLLFFTLSLSHSLTHTRMGRGGGEGGEGGQGGGARWSGAVGDPYLRRSRKPAALDSAMVLSHNSPKSKAKSSFGVWCAVF